MNFIISIIQSMLKDTLGDLPPADRLVLIPMAKEYTAFSLANKGVNTLTNEHRSYYEAIKAAENGWKIRIVNAELKESFQTVDYGELHKTERDLSVLQIFDEEGNDITAEEEWLRAIMNFESIDDDSTDGMVLDIYANNWGDCIRSKTTRHYGENATTKHVYRASFILG